MDRRGLAGLVFILLIQIQHLSGVKVLETPSTALEAHIIETLAIVLGAVGQLHKAWKSETVQKIVTGIKAKKEEAKEANS